MLYRIALLLLLTPALAIPQDIESVAPVFDVEIIVFRHVDPDQTELPVIRDDVDPEPVARPRRERFDPLAAAELRLGDINETLLRSRNWSPILHAGWRQPVESRETAALMPVAGNRRGGAASGTVRLSLDRYLRLEIDLALDDGSGRSYELHQARRVRSGRVHYFDHPRFGVVALVSRTDQ